MATTPVSPILERTLARYGLTSLLTWATEAIVLGWSDDQILLELYERPEFNSRFPGIKAREAAGFPPINPEEYLQYEDMMHSLSTMWGLGTTKTQIDNLISNNVSMKEAEERVNLAAAAVFEDDSETREEIQRLYGVGIGDLINYWMDPKRTMGVLQQQYRSAQIAGTSLRSGFGQISEQQAQRLLQTGMGREQALTGFSQLVANEELFRSTIETEQEISRDQQIELLAGDTDLGKEMETRAARRLADYQGGGGFAAGSTGFAVGSSRD
jgi:hypothetical protein